MPAPVPDPRTVRPVVKSATAFRTISEVSAELDVPQHVLRFWETKFPQIRPLKRGGGRRYYRPEDVDLLRRIRILLYKEGYTIKGVQRLLREQRPVSADSERQEAGAAETGGVQAAESADDALHAGSLTDHQRRELEAVLDELVALRDLLREGA